MLVDVEELVNSLVFQTKTYGFESHYPLLGASPNGKALAFDAII